MNPEAGLLGRNLNAVEEANALPGVLGEEEVAIQVDVVAEARHLARSRDPEPGLEHATEHDAEPEPAGRVHHTDGLPDAA